MACASGRRLCARGKGLLMTRYLVLTVGIMMAWGGAGVAHASFVVNKKNDALFRLTLNVSRWRHVGTYPGGAAPKRWAGSAFVPSLWANATHVFDASGLPQAPDATGIGTDVAAAGDANHLALAALNQSLSQPASSTSGVGHAFSHLPYGALLAGTGGNGNTSGFVPDTMPNIDRGGPSNDHGPTIALGSTDPDDGMLSPEKNRTKPKLPPARLPSVDDVKNANKIKSPHSSSSSAKGGNKVPSIPTEPEIPLLGGGHGGSIRTTAENPEPASITLLGIGGMAIAGSAWWKRRNKHLPE